MSTRERRTKAGERGWGARLRRFTLRGARPEELALIGRNLAPSRRRPQPHGLIALVLAISSAALALSTLRIDQLRLRYALGHAIEQEQALRQERSRLIARMRELRDPIGLRQIASERGFAQPEQIIDLPAPTSPLADARPRLLADVGASLAPTTAAHP